MKINKLSIAGGIAGSSLMITAWIRYIIIYPDLSQAIAWGGVGFSFITSSVIWNKLCNEVVRINEKQEKTDNTLLAIEEYISSKDLEDKPDEEL